MFKGTTVVSVVVSRGTADGGDDVRALGNSVAEQRPTGGEAAASSFTSVRGVLVLNMLDMSRSGILGVAIGSELINLLLSRGVDFSPEECFGRRLRKEEGEVKLGVKDTSATALGEPSGGAGKDGGFGGMTEIDVEVKEEVEDKPAIESKEVSKERTASRAALAACCTDAGDVRSMHVSSICGLCKVMREGRD